MRMQARSRREVTLTTEEVNALTKAATILHNISFYATDQEACDLRDEMEANALSDQPVIKAFIDEDIIDPREFFEEVGDFLVVIADTVALEEE